MKVSIITPVYKVASFIERCVVSLFEQTYKNMEYVFVDDCSPDNSVEILKQVLKRYPERESQVKIISHSTNRGVAAARNTGLETVTGDYVYYVDADDWIEKDAIEQMASLAQKNGSDIVAGGWYLSFSENERRMPMPVYQDVESSLRAMLGGQMRWNLWLFMIRRELYVKYNIAYIEGQNVGEDMLVLVKLFAHAQSISYLNKPVYHYVRMNNASITQMGQQEQIERVKVNLEVAIQYLRSHFGDKYEMETNFMKLNVKLPLLITDDEKDYKAWLSIYPEANPFVWKNRVQTVRTRVVQWMAVKRQFWFLKLYYRLVIKFVYGILYR